MVHSHDHVWNASRDEEERIGQLLFLHGKDQEPAGEIGAGEIGAVAKLVAHGDRRLPQHARDRPGPAPGPSSPSPPWPWPSSRRPRPTSTSSARRCPGSWRRIRRSGWTARPRPASSSSWAQGDSHIAVISERLKRKFGAAVVTRPPRVPYRETIRGHTQVEGRHKKQTGGHGQFGHVWLEIEPNPGGGVEFAEKVVGGAVPRQFFAGVEKGVRDVAAKGPLAGYHVIDFKATLYDGSYHTVDSDELSFRLAAQAATRKGIQEAQPALLEPIMDVTIRVPEAYMGDVNRDLNTRRGRVLGMDSQDGLQIVRAQVPQAELATYATELRSLTGGRGRYSATLDHYEEVPAHVASKIVEAHRKELEAAGGH